MLPLLFFVTGKGVLFLEVPPDSPSRRRQAPPPLGAPVVPPKSGQQRLSWGQRPPFLCAISSRLGRGPHACPARGAASPAILTPAGETSPPESVWPYLESRPAFSLPAAEAPEAPPRCAASAGILLGRCSHPRRPRGD